MWTRLTGWEGDRVMGEQDAPGVRAYNFAEFIGDDDVLALRTALPVGSAAYIDVDDMRPLIVAERGRNR